VRQNRSHDEPEAAMTGTTSDDSTEPRAGQPGRRPGRRRAAVAGGGVAALVAAGVVAASLTGGLTGDENGTADPVVPLGPVQNVALQSFASCDALLTYYRGHAGRLVGPWGGLGTGGGAVPLGGERATALDGGVDAAAPNAAAAPNPGAAKGAADNGATSETGTNVQVAGVDEADSAKLSGDLLLTLENSNLHVTRVAGRTVTPVAKVNLSPEVVRFPSQPGATEKFAPQPDGMPLFSPRQLIVRGTHLVVVGDLQSYPGVVRPDARIGDSGMTLRPTYTQRARLLELDLSDPAAPRRVRALDVDGSVGSARLVGGVLRVTLTTSPHGFPWRTPAYGRDGSVSKSAERRATAANRRLVAEAGIDKWLPSYTLTTFGGGAKPSSGQLLECGDVASPKEFAGVETLSLLSADLDRDGLARPESSAVVAQGSIVYATPEHTYVATPAWQAWAADTATKIAPGGGAGQETAIHQFRSDRTASRYVASGSVPGALLNQFAMDEHEGALRVASTTQSLTAMPVEGDGGIGDGGGTSDSASGTAPDSAAPSPAPSISQVTVLRQQGRALVTVGKVGGLGRGEQIHSVRFIGDQGYVVTFRRTDPLYTIDLADPAKPRVAGELKILGYSAYLHPAGPGRLLGVGQDADADGRVKGLQLSLFDVSDPAAPRRLDAVGMGEAWTDVEGDHHAFTLADGLALAPFQRWGQADATGQQSEFDTGVVAVRLSGTAALAAPKVLRPVADGPVVQPAYGPDPDMERIIGATPQRTFVRDGVVYTVTAAGVAAHDASSLARIGFTPYR
jgi:hypothetical protein